MRRKERRRRRQEEGPGHIPLRFRAGLEKWQRCNRTVILRDWEDKSAYRSRPPNSHLENCS